MEPTQAATTDREDGFKPKWRHFSPMARVWVQNPFEDDIVFQVADEHNRPFRYRLPGGKVSELPGGAIATLGVKKIVDRMITDDKTGKDVASLWDEAVRAKYESKIILRVKETTPTTGVNAGGEINLGTKGTEVDAPDLPVKAPAEVAFPGLNPNPDIGGQALKLDSLPPEAQVGLNDLVSASLPASNDVASANNAHANIEG